MSALGFIGGLAGFATNFQKGYEQSEDREEAKKDREEARQDRAAKRSAEMGNRTFQVTQQNRKLEEQGRADELRKNDAAVPLDEEIDDPSWTPTPASSGPLPLGEEGDGVEAGSETATPEQGPQQAPKIKRLRQWDAVYRDYAANRRKAGDTAGALEFTDKANKITAQRSSNAFMNLQADAGSKTPIQLAREIGKIFDSDPMNGGTKSIEELPNGGVRMTLYNKDTGQTSTKEFTGEKARERLLADFNAYFRPDAYAKLLDKRIETQDARNAELLKPYTLRPGEKRQVMGPDGKAITIGEGNLPKGYELATDEAGNTVMRPSATAGKTSGKPPKTAVEEAQDIMKDALGSKGDGSPEGAARYTRAMSNLDGVFSGNPDISPRVAAAIASDAASDPTKISMQIDNLTGQISKVYSNPDFEGGRQFNLGANAGTVAQMEKAVGKQGMIQSVNGMLDSIAASAPEENRAAIRDQFIAVASNPAARADFLAAAKAGGRDTQALIRQLDLVKAYAPPQKPVTKGPALTPPGGMRQPPTDPTSPAARSQARQAELRADASRKEQERLVAQQALSKQFQADKASMDPLTLAQKYDSLRGQLPSKDAAELQSIERNIR